MTNHPLTHGVVDKIAHSSHWSDDVGDVVFMYYDMRSAADWQLEQVIEWLRSTPSREYVHYWDGDAEMDKDELITDLKKSMRPQQLENN